LFTTSTHSLLILLVLSSFARAELKEMTFEEIEKLRQDIGVKKYVFIFVHFFFFFFSV
jgi:hypothetical protein